MASMLRPRQYSIKRQIVPKEALAVLEGRLETGFEDLTDRVNPLFEYVY